MKSKKHEKIVKDYQKEKAKHLEKLADKMLDNDEKLRKLRKRKAEENFLIYFNYALQIQQTRAHF
jgi:peptidoglycan hydrolase CwlO-like protein